jgi:hypothetical protein
LREEEPRTHQRVEFPPQRGKRERGGILAKRSKHSFIKFRKEIERRKKAEEKMSRRQGKKNMEDDVDNTEEVEKPEASDEGSQES